MLCNGHPETDTHRQNAWGVIAPHRTILKRFIRTLQTILPIQTLSTSISSALSEKVNFSPSSPTFLLRFNTYPANVFISDTGSQLLGFLAVTLALAITQRETPLSPLLTLLLLDFPVLDTLTVMAERIAAGRMPFSPDKNHFHHKLMRLGLFHTEAVATIYAITALLTARAYLLRYHSDWLLLGCYAGFCALVVSAFTAAERRGLRFHRTGFFDVGVKGRLKVFKDKNLLIRVCFLPLQYGLPLLFMAAVLVRGEVPGYLAAVAARRLRRHHPHRPADEKGLGEHRHPGGVLPDGPDGAEPGGRGAGRLGQAGPAGGLQLCLRGACPFHGDDPQVHAPAEGLQGHAHGFPHFSDRPRGPEPAGRFHQRPAPGRRRGQDIVLYFGFEVLVGELRKIGIGILAGLALMAVRAVV